MRARLLSGRCRVPVVGMDGQLKAHALRPVSPVLIPGGNAWVPSTKTVSRAESLIWRILLFSKTRIEAKHSDRQVTNPDATIF